MSDRVKADNLISIVRNTSKKINMGNFNVVNYNDIEEFLDDLTLFFLQTGFSNEEIINMYTEQNVSRRIEMATQSIKKILSLQNRIKDIGKMAERNIQMKRSKELSNEVVKIIKDMTKGDEPTQVDRIIMEFDQKMAPPHIKTIFEENVQRISEIDRNNMEYNVILQYLQWIACLPFEVKT